MEAGLVVGGRVASTVISKLIHGIIDYAKDQKKMQLGLKDELKRLEEGLPKIQAVANAVDQGLIKEKNPALETWLWQLRDAADQADDVMDEMEYNFIKEKVEVGKNKVSKAISNFKTFLERAVYKDPFLKRLIVAVKAVDGVASGVGDFYMLVQDLVKNQKDMVKSAINSRETGPSLEVGNHVYGREKDKDIVIKRLLNPEYKAKEINFAVLPIIGAGGIGKTTLAQLVYNDPVVKKNFPLRMWVCISNNFDVPLLTKKLYESAIGERADVDYFASIQAKLENKLMYEKFLIVFDDAWNDNDRRGWEKLVAPLKCGKSGSMILLTTRMETVARSIGPNVMDSMILKGLNEGDMRGLLEEYAFGSKDPNNYKELVQIGTEIVKKLQGIPLAAKTVGGLLCSNLSETQWTGILESELWSLKQEGPNEIMPALRLTYQHLPSHLKPCLSFCSIFPQDHIFIKDDLINMWVAMGLVPRYFSGDKRPEDVGSEYFEDMLNRSIFSPTNRVRNAHLQYPAYTYYSTAGKQFVGGYIMHDLMHDLSSFVSQGECFRSDRNQSIPIPPTVRHLYIHVSSCSELSNLKLKNVRTLILQFDDYNPTELVCVLNELLKGMTSLRLLTLLSLKLSEIPESIGDLLHLRYLSLSSFMLGEFPSSMSRLYLLETMVCGGFGFTNQANVLVKLINLRHIIASESFVETIAGIGKLTSLQELSFRVDKETGFRISELCNMRDLRRLAITNMNDVVDHEEAKQANLRDKIGLNELVLQWNTTGFDEKVFDHLQPNCNLKELIIRNYMGGRSPFWESGSLSSLVKLEIIDCHNLETLDKGLLQNPNKVVALKELIITNCNELKVSEKGLIEFISLKRLDISSCPKVNPLSALVLLPPHELHFLRINSYFQDSVNDIIANRTIPELQTEEAHELFVLDHPGENSSLEVFLLRMSNHTGKWPPTWLTQTLSMLDSLCIDGRPHKKNYNFSGLPHQMSRLLKFIFNSEATNDVYPSLDIACPSDMPALEQTYFVTSPINRLQYFKKLMVALCSETLTLPSLPVTLKELKLYHLGLVVLPNLCENKSTDSGSLPFLVSMEIRACPNLVSLAEGLFQKPQQFAALERLKIRNCRNLRELPEGGFNKFVSLKELIISGCPKINGQLVPKCFLPSGLQVLHVFKCAGLDANLSRALESVQSLISLKLYGCKKISSLPPKEVFSRWKTLEKLEFAYCNKLTYIESLLGLSSMRLLTIRGCPRLVSAITSLPAGNKDEIEGIVKGGTIQTSNRPASTQPLPTDPCSSTNTEHKPLLFVDELKIDNPLLLSIEPIRSLSSVRELTITWCSGIQSLPELPPILEELSLKRCSPELQRRCEESGEDWPKLSHIPKVSIRDDENWGLWF